MSSLHRGRKGFTLVELMVVMSILAVLSAIVVPAVTGTKSFGEDGRLKSDLQTAQGSIGRFNADSTTSGWPEVKFTDAGDWGLSNDETTALTGQITGEDDLTALSAGYYTALDFDASTTVTTTGGTSTSATFVPDFMSTLPATAVKKPASGKRNVLWLLKIGTTSGVSVRTVEGYKWDAATSKYVKVVAR